ncbi:Respiratory nitrate reductase 2 beta chain [Pseudomonas aeruginosa]|nr:Respiratory nitrate reductase 2 beta chain [Pseudomonas aeruginosa]
MKIRSQVGMVLNLDKCIGCHTCSITCKNVWTSREGMEYAWFNNVETKPGIGYPKEWENQEKWKGGWVRAADGSIRPRIGGKFRVLANIFANPDLPEIDDYYEPFDFDYQHLHTAPKAEHQPVARPRSLVSGQRMEKIEWGPNWEEILGTEFAKRRKDKNFDQVQADIYGEYENTFMMYLPRLCEHCLNPACVASCPSGAIYKREEDGIVLIDQDKCRGWRMCISGCPYKKIYFNWKSGKSEKCIFCYPRIEAGQPTVCSETCVGRIRYLGVLLYDADRIHEVASCENERELYEKQLEIFLDPFDPAVIAQARKDGVADSVIEAAQKSPVYKLAMDWKLALPLHPEYRTLPMVWYVPPLSPIQNAAAEGHIGSDGVIPDVESLRIPVEYLANLLTAGDTAPVLLALKRLLAMRAYKRAEHVEGRQDLEVLAKVGLSVEQVEEMYRYLAIANYEDRFVIPSAHREEALSDAFAERSGCGFSFGNGCSGGSNSAVNLPPRRDPGRADPGVSAMNDHSQLFRLLALLLDYPRAELREESLGLHALIRTCELPEALRDGLAALLNELCQGDLLDVQARYDGLFERGRSVSLLLFEHVHGESRDRGQAMVDLLDRYTGAGLQIDVPELPDYLPLYLEYLSLLPFAAASEGLAEVAHILGLLALRLEERGSAYAAIFEALLELGGERPDLGALRRDQAQEQRDDSLEAIDRAWEETPVSFTDPAGGCPSSSGRRPTASTEQPLQWVAQPVPQMQYRAAREGV